MKFKFKNNKKYKMPRGYNAKHMRMSCGTVIHTTNAIMPCGMNIGGRNIRYIKRMTKLHIAICPTCFYAKQCKLDCVDTDLAKNNTNFCHNKQKRKELGIEKEL